MTYVLFLCIDDGQKKCAYSTQFTKEPISGAIIASPVVEYVPADNAMSEYTLVPQR
jgi:hypothetical protein